jgi:class 3 adenylate cyclase/tetratricopeptide (TPR) repeat protein
VSADSHSGGTRLAGRIEQLLSDARAAREEGDFKALRPLANAVLALDPENREAAGLLDEAVERRQMTLMFCDLVGSTAMAEAHDPEDVREILSQYQRTCKQVANRFGGVIEEPRGDGMLVRFGDPQVHEDDARRAVLSGLEMVRAVQQLGRRLHATYGVDLQVRVSVHTDIVLLQAGIVSGSAPNVAARLQTCARPDTVIISDATQALVRDHFELEPMGAIELRGVSRAVEGFTVAGERDLRRLKVDTTFSPFVGRERERERIEALWRDTCETWRRGGGLQAAAAPRALLVTGAAGIGKSRLVLETVRRLGISCTECRCSSYHQTTSLFAFIRVLEEACGISSDDGADDRLAKLRRRLGDTPDLPFLTSSLQIPATSISPPPDVEATKLRELALIAAARLVHDHGGPGPSMLFVDDLHWADQSSLDLISSLLQGTWPNLCLILVAREGFESPWPGAGIEEMPLAPLDARDLTDLAESVPAGSRLSPSRRRELISRSDGVPLFLEELLRTADAVDQGQAVHRSIDQADYAIPPALRDPLLARLASPGVDLSLAQTASTIGRDVDVAVLRDVSRLSAEALDVRLEALIAAGLVDRCSDEAIRFRHELIRELAYETQTRSARRRRHGAIADYLLSHGKASRYVDAGEVAFHLERAQRYAEAINAHIAAARSAQDLGAHTEATTRLTSALELLARLPGGEARDRTELMVRQLRSFSAMLASGYAAPEAAEDHPRCVELCERLGLAPELVPSLIATWSYYVFIGNLAEAEDVNAKMARMTDEADFPMPLAGRALIRFFRGRFTQAHQQMEAFVANPWSHVPEGPPAGWPLPNDPLAAMTAHMVPTLWIAGECAAAEEKAERALHRAERLSFPHGPFSVAYVHSLLAMTRRMDGDHEAAERHARAMIEVSEAQGSAMWHIIGHMQAGLTALHGGDAAQYEELVGGYAPALTAGVWSPYWMTELGAAQRALGRGEDALRSLDLALALTADTGAEFYRAETLRMRGELRIELGDEDGTADLEAALAQAREQEAALFELRAAISLARPGSGSVVANEALASAIGRFSGDAHPRELDEARALVAL